MNSLELVSFVARRSVRLIIGVAAVLLCVNAAASDAAPDRVNAWSTPHVLTISDAADLTTLNPHLSQNAPTANLSELTMAWLIRWDTQNAPYPELATAVPTRANGGVSSDGRTITYHLRRGVRWADGAPFTADDVVFSTNVVNNPANDEAGRFDQLAWVRAPDKYTVIFHLKKPFATSIAAFFSSCCANPSLLPKHFWRAIRTSTTFPTTRYPLASGPLHFPAGIARSRSCSWRIRSTGAAVRNSTKSSTKLSPIATIC